MPLAKRFRVVFTLAALLLVVHLLNWLSGYGLLRFGLIPRTLDGLQGIAFAPLLHGSGRHLLSNLPPLMVLSWLALSEGLARYLKVLLLIALVGGVLVWALGRSSVHVGASGVVFGLWSYLLARAWYQRSLASVLVALVVVGVYGGLLFGFVPVSGVSVESHLAGALAGVFASWLMHAKTAPAAADRIDVKRMK